MHSLHGGHGVDQRPGLHAVGRRPEHAEEHLLPPRRSAGRRGQAARARAPLVAGRGGDILGPSAGREFKTVSFKAKSIDGKNERDRCLIESGRQRADRTRSPIQESMR